MQRGASDDLSQSVGGGGVGVEEAEYALRAPFMPLIGFPTEGFNTFSLKGVQWKMRNVHMLIKFIQDFVVRSHLKSVHSQIQFDKLRVKPTPHSKQQNFPEKGCANIALAESRNLFARIFLLLLSHRILHNWILQSAVISCN